MQPIEHSDKITVIGSVSCLVSFQEPSIQFYQNGNELERIYIQMQIRLLAMILFERPPVITSVFIIWEWVRAFDVPPDAFDHTACMKVTFD